MAQTSTMDYSAREKAAILLIALGRDHSAKVLQQLNEDEIEQLTLEIANMRRVDPQVQTEIMNEFNEACMAQNYILEGGIDYAREVLDKAIGEQRAQDLIGKLSANLQVRPFDFTRRLDAAQLLTIIQNEQPQTIALILAYIEPSQAAAILGALSQEIQSDVVARIAKMGKTSPEHIRDVERILEKKMSTMGVTDYAVVSGVNTTVEILNAIDRSTEKHILESLGELDQELVEEIKSRMFMFEDIAKLNRTSIQRVLKDVANEDLILALKGVRPEVSDFVFENLSQRLQEMIREEMEIRGQVRLRDVEEAQQKIVNIIRTLDESGEIIIARGQEEQLVG